jgi:hypothetical protein
LEISQSGGDVSRLISGSALLLARQKALPGQKTAMRAALQTKVGSARRPWEGHRKMRSHALFRPLENA